MVIHGLVVSVSQVQKDWRATLWLSWALLPDFDYFFRKFLNKVELGFMIELRSMKPLSLLRLKRFLFLLSSEVYLSSCLKSTCTP